jgi:2-hydroxychromene-2-carboxylate isomerase
LATNLGDVPTPAAFYFDLASPLAYLAAERILQVFSSAAGVGSVEWRPVLAGDLDGAQTFDSFRCAEERDASREDVERRAAALGLQPLRWPQPFPFDSSLAMRVATYAASIGRAIPFAQAAFRQAFAGGHSLADPDYVLIAAAACEMHPRAVLQGAELDTVAQRLASTTAGARAAGVVEVPAVLVGKEVFHGERELERAAAHVRDGHLDAGDGGDSDVVVRDDMARASDAGPNAPTDHAGAAPR